MQVQYSVSVHFYPRNYTTLTDFDEVMYFEAYPLIFQGVYGMSDGIAGLAFLPSMC